MSSPSGDVVLMDPNNVNVYITANDNPEGILGLRALDFVPLPHINEDVDSDIIYTIVRTAGSFGSVSVQWEIIRNDSGLASVILDISPATGTVTFASGEHERAITLHIEQDVLPEPAERFKLRLIPETVSGGAQVEGITEGIIIIEDSDNIYGMVEFAADSQQKLIIVSIEHMMDVLHTRIAVWPHFSEFL